jgi:hypothetical protein
LMCISEFRYLIKTKILRFNTSCWWEWDHRSSLCSRLEKFGRSNEVFFANMKISLHQWYSPLATTMSLREPQYPCTWQFSRQPIRAYVIRIRLYLEAHAHAFCPKKYLVPGTVHLSPNASCLH